MQLTPMYAEIVGENFFGWVKGFDQDFASLQNYIVHWLLHDDGVETVGGDYANLLLAVLIIIDQYSKDPSSLDYWDPDGIGMTRARRVDILLDLDSPGAAHFTYQMFQQMVFRRFSGHRTA